MLALGGVIIGPGLIDWVGLTIFACQFGLFNSLTCVGSDLAWFVFSEAADNFHLEMYIQCTNLALRMQRCTGCANI